LTKKQLWFILVSELIMTETKPIEPSTFPEPDKSTEPLSGAAVDPGQTKLLPPLATLSEKNHGNSPVADSGNVNDLAAVSRPVLAIKGWLKKLTQTQIIWISFSIILIFLVVLFLLIIQGRQKNKTIKPDDGEQIETAGEVDNMGSSGIQKNISTRRAAIPVIPLTDDEFIGQAPMVVKTSSPVISAEMDPELAAMVDALKKRLQIFADSKSTSRGNIVTKVTKGDFRGFKINLEERIENKNTVSEEVTVTLPKKGYIKTVNRVLDSIRESDLERFSVELQNAGLEIIKFPLQPGNNVFQVQFKTISIFGKPIAHDFLISGKNVGKISLGMPAIQMETMLLSSYIVLKRKMLFNDIYYDVYKVLDQSNEPLFFVYESKGRVWGISIISDIFKTEKGIGIGSSLGDMRINYPRINAGISEKRTPFVKIDGIEGLFIIQSEGVNVLRRIFPSNTKIFSILIGNSPEFE
jgi:hypothetical protein